jgi:uncharacterized Zn finger protein
MNEQTIIIGDFTLTILKENDKHYIARCSGCGLVTPSKKFKTPLEEWFKFHLTGFKTTHKGEIPTSETVWRIN